MSRRFIIRPRAERDIQSAYDLCASDSWSESRRDDMRVASGESANPWTLGRQFIQTLGEGDGV
jgi:hypothetical protein